MPGDGNGQLWEDERMIDLETKSELLDGGTCVVSVAGELDMSTAPRFKQTLLGALGNAPASVIVDLTECEFIDSSALNIIIGARQRLDGDGVSVGLSIVTPNPTVRRVFEITGLDTMFAIHPSRAAAMNGGTHV
jgi:anti-sigma B factor antagonist